MSLLSQDHRFNRSAMAVKCYLRQVDQHGAASDGLTFRYWDAKQDLSDLVATDPATKHAIYVVIHSHRDFNVITRGYSTSLTRGFQAAYRSKGQLVWKGIVPCLSTARSHSDLLQTTTAASQPSRKRFTTTTSAPGRWSIPSSFAGRTWQLPPNG